MAVSRYYSNTAVPGALGAGISSSSASMYLAATPVGYPAQFPFTLVLEPGTANMELVSIGSGSGTSGSPWVFSSPGGRGFDGTVALAHSATAVVQHNFSAGDLATSRTHESLGSGSSVHGLPASAWTTSSLALVASTRLSNSTTSVVTWASIPQTYSHLLVLAQARLTETSASVDDIWLQFNGDSGAVYSYLTMSLTNASGSLLYGFGNGSSVTSVPAFRVLASQTGAPANAGGGFAFIPWYSATAFNKSVYSMSGGGYGTSALLDGRLRWCFYNPAVQAAVTSITLTAGSGTDFLTGSSFSLYAMA